MPLNRPQPGSRLGCDGSLADPLCHVKSNEELMSTQSHENYKTTAGQWFERRREIEYVNHCEALDSRVPQMDDGADRSADQFRGERSKVARGGPVQTVEVKK